MRGNRLKRELTGAILLVLFVRIFSCSPQNGGITTSGRDETGEGDEEGKHFTVSGTYGVFG